MSTVNPFPNYTELPRRVPVRAWHPIRALSVAVFLGLCVALFVRPAGALFFFWRLLIPMLPLVFLLAPGLWRNVCPLAAANQAPRLWNITRGLKQPGFLRDRGYVVAIVLFAAIVVSRKPLFDKHGAALAFVLLALITAAFVMGTTYRGKSGWCSSVCPLLPVQRLYGQTPFVTVPNSHCQPCVGCTKNCYDFNPGAAYQADMHEHDEEWSAPRKFFAGAFPGLIAGFFTVSATASTLDVYGHILMYAAVGAGAFFAVDAILPVTSSQAAVLGGAVALNLFYWHQGPLLADAWGEVVNADIGWLSWLVRGVVPALTLVWLWRTFRVERRYEEVMVASARPVKLSATRAAKLKTETAADGPEVVFEPGERRVVSVEGATLLDVAESDGQPIEAGCRMGVCGADPVAVLDGMGNLSPVGTDEAATLRRLNLGPSARMACSARLTGGPVCVNVDVSVLKSAGEAAPDTAPTDFDPTITRVVVLGNGIAGVTAADYVRRSHPECEIHLVGKEPYPLYNRMGISRIVYGRSAMQGLSLLPDTWYDDNKVTCWLNTQAQRLDIEQRHVELATGDMLPYDRLILATGSSSFVPPIPGFGAAGSFVLREADDAVAIRRYAQQTGARRAVVAGGGLLGLEAAHALHSLGLATTVVELAPRLLINQADERASALLADFLENLGIRVETGTSIGGVDGDPVRGVTLADGRSIECELFLVAAGIKPNVELARDAGLEVNRGVVVDDRMRTSVPGVYAAGDVAELDGRVWGLWPIAVNQGEVAARNAMGADEAHVVNLPFAMLKGVGLDLLSAGRINPDAEAGDTVYVVDHGREHQYAKVVVGADGRVVGGLLLGRPQDHHAVGEAVKSAAVAEPLLAALGATPLAASVG